MPGSIPLITPLKEGNKELKYIKNKEEGRHRVRKNFSNMSVFERLKSKNNFSRAKLGNIGKPLYNGAFRSFWKKP